MRPPLRPERPRKCTSEVIVLVASVNILNMPADRRKSGAIDGSEGSQTGHMNSRRSVQHVTRACEACRKRFVTDILFGPADPQEVKV